VKSQEKTNYTKLVEGLIPPHLRPDISSQRAKYQLIADIIKFQWLGVKVSFESVEKPFPESWFPG
jgi:hypothetical protein